MPSTRLHIYTPTLFAVLRTINIKYQEISKSDLIGVLYITGNAEIVTIVLDLLGIVFHS